MFVHAIQLDMNKHLQCLFKYCFTVKCLIGWGCSRAEWWGGYLGQIRMG